MCRCRGSRAWGGVAIVEDAVLEIVLVDVIVEVADVEVVPVLVHFSSPIKLHECHSSSFDRDFGSIR